MTRFRVIAMTREIFADRIAPERMGDFVRDVASYRMDEVLGPWKPYRDVIVDALMRAARLWSIRATRAEGEAYYDAVPTWGPHPDVPAGLARLASRIPLVILSNASNSQIAANVDMLGAAFQAVDSAEMAQAYKPRMKAFEFMFDHLGCRPADVLHVSSSYRDDLMIAHDMRVGMRVGMRALVDRAREPHIPHYGAVEIADIGALPGLVGL